MRSLAVAMLLSGCAVSHEPQEPVTSERCVVGYLATAIIEYQETGEANRLGEIRRSLDNNYDRALIHRQSFCNYLPCYCGYDEVDDLWFWVEQYVACDERPCRDMALFMVDQTVLGDD